MKVNRRSFLALPSLMTAAPAVALGQRDGIRKLPRPCITTVREFNSLTDAIAFSQSGRWVCAKRPDGDEIMARGAATLGEQCVVPVRGMDGKPTGAYFVYEVEL